jgi:Pyruvate/2-oxoacid:ferredoxin oxidoreductase gamma subunit
MPTVVIVGPYRFFFYSNERGEPSHIHVRRDRALAKFWLEPISLAKSKYFSAHELNVIRTHIEDNVQVMLEAWNEHHGG